MLIYPASPVQILQSPLLREKKLTVMVKRDDLNHPVVSGNKLRKLKYNLHHAKQHQYEGILTFGGAFSNHIYATAMACKLAQLKSKLIIRGIPLDVHNPTLKYARACGAELIAVDRMTYKRRNDNEYLNALQALYPNYWVVPEGGSNQLALEGLRDLANELPPCDYVACAVGSGGTLSGMTLALPQTTQLLGFVVLKGAEQLKADIVDKYPEMATRTNWQLIDQFHGGGYGRFTPELWHFCQHFKAQHGISIEPIYTGKLLFGLWQLIEQDFFKPHSTLCVIHSGGLQGLMGLKYRGLI